MSASILEVPKSCALSQSPNPSSPDILDNLLCIPSNFETLFNLAPVGYLIVYEDMVIREVNCAAATMLGVPRPELLGNPLIIYVQAQSRESLRTHFRHVLTGREENIELDFDHPSGVVRMQLHSARIQGPSIGRPRYLCSLIDLSGRQHSQDELVRHQARLKAVQLEQTKRLAELQDRLLEESTIRRKAQQEARLHIQAVQERSEELDRLRRDLADQTAKQQQTEQHLVHLQQHLSRLTQGSIESSISTTEPISSETPSSEDLPSPAELHKLHHRLLSRIEKLDNGLRRRQTEVEPKIRLICRLLAESDRYRGLLSGKSTSPMKRSLVQSLQTNEILLQKTCRLNSIAAWQYDLAQGQWTSCTGLALLMGIRQGTSEPDPSAFCTAIVPEDRPIFLQFLQSPPSDLSSRIVDIHLIRANGTVRHLRHCLDVTQRGDKPARLSAVVFDITAWKKGELFRIRCFQQLGRLGRDQIEGLSVQRDQLLLEQSSLRAQVEDFQRQRQVLENRIEVLQSELGRLRQQHGAERERNRQLVAQFHKHKARLSQVVGERTRQIEDIRRSVVVREKNQQARIAELTVQLEESRSVADEHLRKMHQIQEWATGQQQSAQLQLLNDREVYGERIGELTNSLAAAQQDSENERRSFRQMQSDLIEQRDTLQAALAEAESKAEQLEITLEKLRYRHESSLAHASEQIDGLKTQIAQSQHELSDSQSECRRLAEETKTVRAEGLRQIETLQHDLDLTQATVTRFKEKLRSQEQQAEQSNQDLHSDLCDLRFRLDECEADFDAFLRMVRSDIQRLLGRFQTTIDNDELANLASQIAELADMADLLMVSGQTESFTTVDPNSLLEGVLDSFHDWIQQTDAQIEVGQFPQCRANPNLLTRIFIELMDNAMKFLSSDRPGRIVMTAWIQDREWLFRIEDNGIGMAADQIDRAFELGVQLAGDVPGRGVGLAIVRRIVNLHHGRIEVDSQPGGGTSLLLALPLD